MQKESTRLKRVKCAMGMNIPGDQKSVDGRQLLESHETLLEMRPNHRQVHPV